jgi:hypothetical protein
VGETSETVEGVVTGADELDSGVGGSVGGTVGGTVGAVAVKGSAVTGTDVVVSINRGALGSVTIGAEVSPLCVGGLEVVEVDVDSVLTLAAVVSLFPGLG